MYGYTWNEPINNIDPNGKGACIYDRKTGTMACISSDGRVYGDRGFVSGRPPFQNVPIADIFKDQGPIPAGIYMVGPQKENSTRRNLTPVLGTDMQGRDSFQTHGCPNTLTCSEGCIASPKINEFNDFINSDSGPTVIIVQ